MKKYELLTDDTIEVCGRTLFRIRALVSFGSVEAGHVGGYIESENNLSQVYGNAWVSGNAQVSGDAQAIWFSNVGSEGGTLTAYRTENGIGVTRGCFTGTLDEFEAAVLARHGDNQVAREYALLIEFIKLRLTK